MGTDHFDTLSSCIYYSYLSLLQLQYIVFTSAVFKKESLLDEVVASSRLLREFTLDTLFRYTFLPAAQEHDPWNSP